VTNGNAYIEKTVFVQEKYKNGAKISVLYICWMFFSMYAGSQMLYNESSHMDKSVMLTGGADVERRRTVGEYRLIDLTMFALMVFLGEMAIVMAAKMFPRELYVFSVTPVVTAIVMMRWGPWAAVHAALGGLALCIGTGADAAHYAIYCGGNLLGLCALALLKALGKERVREDAFHTVVFGLTTALLMQLGRGLVSVALGGEAGAMFEFFRADVLTLLFTAVVIGIVRRLDGVFEDQIKYLLRISAEQDEERESSDEG